ncbi:MAG: molybdenum cofactor biosynthesis protein MoaE [Armatimonadetes bacterium]|nr:molybdenum cofactor biosynthesis protein MoaE [Anaerolineae bacterium]
MRVTILLFATLKDIAGGNQLSLTLPGDTATLADVRQTLTDQYPQMQENLKVALAAINQEYAFAGDSVHEGDDIAFFPPVSGGEASDDPAHPEIIQLADAPLDHDALIAAITTPATGAVCLFSGMVRGMTHKEGHLPQTDYLEYEAYAPMALAKMRQVAAEIRSQWGLVQGIAIVQRIGKLSVGQNTVLIACSAGHRDDGCFEAARYGIDRLKEIVPVWKKEIGRDGTAWIEGAYHPTPEDRATGQT